MADSGSSGSGERVGGYQPSRNATDSALEEAMVAFIDGLVAHADHPKKQVGPCVYCEPCGVRLYQGEDPQARPDDGPEPDYEDWLRWNVPSDEDLIPEECPVCHARGACGYDDEGRSLIHSLNADDAAESAVEEAVRA